MKLQHFLTTATSFASLAAGNAFGPRTRRPRSRPRSAMVTASSLEKLYKAKAELKGEVAKAPGYAVFTTYGLRLSHRRRRRQRARPRQQDEERDLHGHGAGERRAPDRDRGKRDPDRLQSSTAMQDFIDKGWEAGGGGAVQAGAAGKSVARGGRRERGRRRVLLHPDARTGFRWRRGCRAEVLEGQGADLSAPARGESSASQTRGRGRGCDLCPRVAPRWPPERMWRRASWRNWTRRTPWNAFVRHRVTGSRPCEAVAQDGTASA